MSAFTRVPGLYVAQTARKGRGIYTAEFIASDSLIEICPVVVCSKVDLELIHKTKLHDYYFMWGENDDHCAIALGYGSLYNHSYQPNARYEVDFEEEVICFYTIHDVQVGEEVCVNYNGVPEDDQELWFFNEVK